MSESSPRHTILRTPRFILRAACSEDPSDLYEILSDPEVAKYGSVEREIITCILHRCTADYMYRPSILNKTCAPTMSLWQAENYLKSSLKLATNDVLKFVIVVRSPDGSCSKVDRVIGTIGILSFGKQGIEY